MLASRGGRPGLRTRRWARHSSQAVLSTWPGRRVPLRPGGKATMILAIAATVFPIIFLGELPNKTIRLARAGDTRRAFGGLAWSGQRLRRSRRDRGNGRRRLVPGCAASDDRRSGAPASSLPVPSSRCVKSRKNDVEVTARRRSSRRGRGSHRQTALTAFVVIFIAGWGDLTQILSANLAAHYHSPVSVGAGALAAL